MEWFARASCNFSFLENSQAQINSTLNEKTRTYDYLLIIFTWRKIFFEAIFSQSGKRFSKFLLKIFIILRDTNGLEISYCLSANHNSELRCAICTCVTLFVLVLHLNCTALSQSESSTFFMYIVIIVEISIYWKRISTKRKLLKCKNVLWLKG